MPRRTAVAALLSALSLAALPGMANAADDGSDPSPASCTTTDGTVIETGETHDEFQADGRVLELTCDDGILCGTTFYDEHPGVPKTFACESWGETAELMQQEQPRARHLGVLTVTRAGAYRASSAAPRRSSGGWLAWPPHSVRSMRYRKLGSSDLEVSEISLGSWLTFSGGIELEATRACTDAAFEAGINFLDTANVYGRGAAESAWGEILSGRPRDSYVLATKVWGQMSDDPEDRGLSAAQIARQIDASLQRLRTDHVDLYQAHRFDIDVPIEETIEALQEVVRSGKARYLGFSEWTPEQIATAVEIAGPELFVSSQPQYSMLWQAPEAEVFGLSAANGISQIVWSPLAQGVLTGKYRPGEAPPTDSRAASDVMNVAMGRVMSDATLQAVERLRPVADEAGLTLPELALAWVLRRPEVASAIVGASRPEQVHANAKASGIELSADTLAAIDEALGDAPVKEPTLASFAPEGVRRR